MVPLDGQAAPGEEEISPGVTPGAFSCVISSQPCSILEDCLRTSAESQAPEHTAQQIIMERAHGIQQRQLPHRSLIELAPHFPCQAIQSRVSC